jgi:predicted nucleic acid-binding protein
MKKNAPLAFRISSELKEEPAAEAELAATCGLLDPAHTQTPEIIEQIAAVIDRRPSYRTITPDPEIWREAGELSGTLARTQGYGREQRRRVLNDALLFATARKYGCALLSRNVRDFDLLQKLDPSGKIMFYKMGAS